METRGLFKRIAAITMAALTIVTSSGVDVNLLTANANELTKQATENSVDENTNKALRKKDAKVGAQAKLSFSTNEALKRAVDDAGFNIDVKTNKVTSAAIKYNQSLLRLGEDFTATAKRTDCKQNSSKYNYVYTVTVTGKGDYTGSTTRTGVTQVSDIKPATAKKKAKKASAKESTAKKTPKKAPKEAGVLTDGSYDAGQANDNKEVVESSDGWKVKFDTLVNLVSDTENGGSKRLTAIYKGKVLNPKVTVYYGSKELTEDTDYTLTYDPNGVKNNEAGTNTGTVIVTAMGDQLAEMTGKNTSITCHFDIVDSITTKAGYVSLIESSDQNTAQNRNKHIVYFKNQKDYISGDDYNYIDGLGYANGSFEYTGNAITPKVIVRSDVNGTARYNEITTSNAAYGQIIEYDKDGTGSKVGRYTSHLKVKLGSTYGNEEISIYYTIVARSVSDKTMTVDDVSGDYSYTGKPVRPALTVKDTTKSANAQTLNEADIDNNREGYKNVDANGVPTDTDSDYYVTYSNNVNAGKATATVHGMNNYGGTVDKDFTINQQDVTSTDTSKSNIDIQVAKAIYDGKAQTPAITVTDKNIVTRKDEDGNDVYKVLTQGTDYTVSASSYHNNTAVHEAENAISDANKNSAPYVEVKFCGNYKGTIQKPFAITSAKINSANFKVQLDDNDAYTFNNEQDNITYAPSLLFDPIDSEAPDVTITDPNGNKLVKGTDYDVKSSKDNTSGTGKPTNSTSSVTWPQAGPGWSLYVEGKGSYDKSGFTINFTVIPLPLNDSHIRVTDLKTDSAGQWTADVKYYSSKTNGSTKTLTANTDYTIQGPTKAGKETTLTLKAASGNYTDGTQTVESGTDLATLNASQSADLRLTLYDPLKGTKLGDGTYMTYYGDNVPPHVVIEKKNASGKYDTLTEDADFTVAGKGDSTKVTGTTRMRHTMVITAVDSSTNLYGSKEISYETTPYSMSSDSNSKALDSAFWIESNVTNRSEATMDNITVWFNPMNTISTTVSDNTQGGQSASGNSGTGSVKVTYAQDTNEPNRIRITLGDNKTTWLLPPIQSRTLLNDGSEFTLSKATKITINGKNRTLKGGEILLNGQGNFGDMGIWNLGTPSITTDDFYVEYKGDRVEKNQLPDIEFDQQNHLPQVDLKQVSTAATLTPKKTSSDTNYDYTVTYRNTNGKEVTLDSLTNNATTEDFKSTGTYSIILNADEGKSGAGSSGNGGTNTGSFKGQITITYRIVPRSGLKARFNKGQDNPVKYNGDKTYKPVLDPVADKDNKGPELIVTDGNKTLTYGENKDYIVDEKANDTKFQQPGRKTVHIVGKGTYEGVEFDSDSGEGSAEGYYIVQANLSDFDAKDSSPFTVEIGDGSSPAATKSQLQNDLKTLYWDGSDLKTAAGQVVSEDTIDIKAGSYDFGTTSDRKYRIDGLSNVSAGDNHKITFTGTSDELKGSFSIIVDIKINRSGLKWSRNNSDTITLPYDGTNYQLGQGLLAITNDAASGNISLESTGNTKDKVAITANKLSSTIESNDFSKATKENIVNAEFNLPGKYDITITGPQNSTGSTTLHLNILYDLSDTKVTYNNKELQGRQFDYTGNNPVNTSEIKVTLNKGVNGKTRELVNDTDYTIPTPTTTGDSLSDVGAVTATLKAKSGISSYTFDTKSSSEKTITYQIVQLSVAGNLTVAYKGGLQGASNEENSSGIVYDGQSHAPTADDLTVTWKKDDTSSPLTLTEGTDYTITLATGDNFTDRGHHTFYIVGKGNYTGTSQAQTFYIAPFDLTNQTVQADGKYYYNGGDDVWPDSVKVKLKDGQDAVSIKRGTDYTAAKADGYEDKNKKIGSDNKVLITAIEGGNYTGSTNFTFAIEKLDLSAVVTNLPIHRDYTGSSIDAASMVVLRLPGSSNKQLKLDDDYTLQFQKSGSKPVARPKDAGKYNVIITAVAGSDLVQGNSYTVENGFVIDPLSLKDHKGEFKVEDAEWANGAPVEPKVTRNGNVVNTNEYSVTYENNTDPCSSDLGLMQTFQDGFSKDMLPVAHIKGQGNYTGSIDLYFSIGHPLSATNASQKGTIQYDGQEHAPMKGQNFTVTYKGKTVDQAAYDVVDVTDADYVNAGTKSVTLRANTKSGGFYGTKSFDFTIAPNSTTMWGFSLDLDKDSNGNYAVQYEGAAVTPAVRVYLLDTQGNQTILDANEYTVTYSNNNKAGTASVRVTPTNYSALRCSNDNPLTFRILGADITGSQFRVRFTDGVTRRKYTGSAISPAVRVTMLGSRATVTLTQGTDFTVSYKNNTNAGKATATVTGIGSYTGTVNLDYAIWTSLTDKTTTITVPKQMYTGEPITELKGVTIKAGGNNLVLDTDYSLVISSSDSFRTKGTAAFTGKGDYYEGTKTINFDIGNDASMYNVIGVSATYVFDHQAHKPVPVVTDKEGTVYPVDSVSYASTSDGDSCINAGNVRMQIAITSHGQTVSIPYNYTIERRDINTATFTPIADVDYNGKAHTPNVRVTEGTRLLTGTQTTSDGSADFTYTYYNNVQPGTATVTINGINNYTGIANLYFSINVKEAPQMKVTAMPSGRLKVSWNKVNGVSGYRIFYSPQGGSQKQVNIGSSKKTTYLTGLTRGVLYTVGLQSYVRANGQNGYSSASVQQIATSTTQPKITSAKSTGKGKIKLTWKKVSNATAYMVYRKTAGSTKWTRVKTTKSTSYTNTGFKSGKSYTYKVISYKQSGVKRSFSKYSKGKTVRAK